MSTNTIPSTATTSSRSKSAPFNLRRFGTLVLAATLLNLIAFWVAGAAGAVMTIDTPGYQTITAELVAVTTLVPLALAGFITWLVARKRPRLLTFARWAGLGVAFISMASPFLVADDLGTAIALAAMHLVVAATWFVGLRSRQK